MTSVRLARADLKVICDEIQGLHVIREDIRRVGDLLERLLEEALAVEQTRADLPRPEPAAGTGRGAVRVPVSDTRLQPSPVHRTGWREEALDPGMRVHRDEHERGSSGPNPVPAVTDPAWRAPAAAQPHEPSSVAEPVEASNDTVISSQRHPPEAWLERKGGEGEVWLNARVALTDAGLQRWSTFFDWERRDPGARYQVTRPATVTSSGSLVSKGVARPL